jgi:hypothetical protein
VRHEVGFRGDEFDAGGGSKPYIRSDPSAGADQTPHATPTAARCPSADAQENLMRHVIVRYTVKADRAEENEQLVRAVYDELHSTQPAGLS